MSALTVEIGDCTAREGEANRESIFRFTCCALLVCFIAADLLSGLMGEARYCVRVANGRRREAPESFLVILSLSRIGRIGGLTKENDKEERERGGNGTGAGEAAFPDHDSQRQ